MRIHWRGHQTAHSCWRHHFAYRTEVKPLGFKPVSLKPVSNNLCTHGLFKKRKLITTSLLAMISLYFCRQGLTLARFKLYIHVRAFFFKRNYFFSLSLFSHNGNDMDFTCLEVIELIRKLNICLFTYDFHHVTCLPERKITAACGVI